MAAGASAAAAAQILRKRRLLASSAFGVIEVSAQDFLTVIELEEQPLVVISQKTKFWSSEPTGRYRYICSIKGMMFFVDYTEEITLPPQCIVIEAKSMRVAKDI